jgi:hypothetical protein
VDDEVAAVEAVDQRLSKAMHSRESEYQGYRPQVEKPQIFVFAVLFNQWTESTQTIHAIHKHLAKSPEFAQQGRSRA